MVMASREKKFNQIKYQDDYNRKNYDRISLRVPKGKKEIIQQAAKDAGESVNEYIIKSVFERMNMKQ